VHSITFILQKLKIVIGNTINRSNGVEAYTVVYTPMPNFALIREGVGTGAHSLKFGQILGIPAFLHAEATIHSIPIYRSR